MSTNLSPRGLMGWAFATCLLLAIFAISLNKRLFPDVKEIAKPAIKWQDATKGIVEIPDAAVLEYKKELINRHAQDADIVIFGASTSLGLGRSSFPNRSVLNASSYGNPISNVADQLKQITETKEAGTLLVSVDWLIMYIFAKHGKQANEDLQGIGFIRRNIEDTLDLLSKPQLQNLAQTTYRLLLARNFTDQLLHLYPESKCADGSVIKEYNPAHHGTCAGFLYDGSRNWNERSPINQTAEQISQGYASLNGTYPKLILESRGRPDTPYWINNTSFREITQKLALAAKRWKEKGGKILFFMPPHIPTYDVTLEHSGREKEIFEMRDKIISWSRTNNLELHDFGKSENWGCTTFDFFDEVHPLPSCYQKIFPPKE